jgi:nitrogen-specific signal transduction histidine kinase
MAVIKKDSQPFEPYARLMNIIGDQLITDKKVAVMEIIKNSYDADAENVEVRFYNLENYGKNYLTEKEQPYIEIKDDGEGMTLDTIRDVWLKPATPNKYIKRKNREDITDKGRKIQGEKGIGRFAVHKLGEKIEVYTRAKTHNEVKLQMDFSEYNPEKIDLFNQPPVDYKLLNDVRNDWFVNDPPEEIKKSHGTLIRIYILRDEWKEVDFKELYKSIQRLIPPFDENAQKLGIKFIADFSVKMFVDNHLYVSEQVTTFKDVVEQAQYTMIGNVTSDGEVTFEYKCISPRRNIKERSISLLNEEQMGRFSYDSKAIKKWKRDYEKEIPKCGPFLFTFYAYDLKNKDKNILNKDIETFIKDNFVFLYRDGVRVYPYGEKGQDWLELDKLRATVRAASFISYNDLTGFIYISRDKNKLLIDSTNRQGMMHIDGAFNDFTALITAVTEIFNTEIKIDKNKLEIKNRITLKETDNQVTKSFDEFSKSLNKINNREVLEKANKFLDKVQKHVTIIKDRMSTVEDLAGLGMAVEKSSHDALMLLKQMWQNLKDFKIKVMNKDYTDHELLELLSEVDENLEIIYEELQIIQPLFKIQRKAISDVSVYDNIEKVKKYFRRELENKIDIQIIKDKDVIVKTNPGLVLQVLINLLDNAIYWVNKSNKKKKEILFKINSKNNSILVADNGPGIREDVEPLIFQEFFSLKSDGRGLGLYIVKEILLRINAEISVIQDDNKKLLPGANFLVKFNSEEI